MDYMTFRRLNEDFELTATVKPDKEVKIEAEGDKADELEDFARSILGDNFDFFDQDFDDEEKEEDEDNEEGEQDEEEFNINYLDENDNFGLRKNQIILVQVKKMKKV